MKFDYDYDTFFSENFSCSPINCNFNNDNFCEWVSLDDDSDIILTFSMYQMNIKEWSLDNQQKRKNYIYAGNTNNPNDIFILSTQKEVFFNQPSRILFDFYHAGIHGELKVCLNTINECPFSFSSSNLTMNARKWQKGEIIIPNISKHRIFIYASGLINNYFIGFDNIRLVQLNTFKKADCS
ncbi:Concanavalin A-like lectin/glucanases superfamily domain-containing protein [Strongyloides ratti]|uniref:Concanavalin A-like lectin/glucanases superfamily domain-containing protein n=1 Tax=Strongyloides ratti TaxID=34506 RepID=A0A090KQF1_STRRB|nr:Concanavalin A-like lectin/glucanases superfamily domain-containing protein [Strongyloides ratti]CEF59743.1 Concanavalin A-like lectin/glucanases superfamily domain-containing protein [Strongyloides ratti]